MIIVKNFSSRNLKDYERVVAEGGRFVFFQYAGSIGFYSMKKSSPVFLVRGNESALLKGLGYTLFTFVAGWWGFPWGPIFTIQSLIINLRGGEDVTDEVIESAILELDPMKQYF